MDKRIKIAVQKSGRLHDSSLQLLKECGIKINNGKQQLKAQAVNFPAEILFLRDDDIPQYVEDGVADIGIIGENVWVEKNRQVELKEKLGFSKCRLSLAVPKNTDYTDLDYFEGKKIATSYPIITQQYLDNKGIKAEIHEISGSVEIAPGIGLAEGICDIVSTGSTLLSNGLKEVETVMHSEAVLIAHQHLSNESEDFLNQLLFRIKSVQTARNNKYILLNAPNESIEKIKEIIPGMKSPTIMPLAQEGWSTMHSVVNENDFWNKIDQLRNLGAEGILVIPIEKMIL